MTWAVPDSVFSEMMRDHPLGSTSLGCVGLLSSGSMTVSGSFNMYPSDLQENEPTFPGMEAKSHNRVG